MAGSNRGYLKGFNKAWQDKCRSAAQAQQADGGNSKYDVILELLEPAVSTIHSVP